MELPPITHESRLRPGNNPLPGTLSLEQLLFEALVFLLYTGLLI